MSKNRHMPTKVVEPKEKIDRRVMRTRQMLRDALMSLILERGYDAVTVEAIAERANLGRATFYLHYRDKQDLLIQNLKATYDELLKTIRSMQSGLRSVVIFQHAAENKDLYRVMLSGQGATALALSVREYIVDALKLQITTTMPRFSEQLPVPLDVLAQHIGGSLLGLVTWWLENNLPYTPDEMAQYFRLLNVESMLAFAAQRQDP